MNFFDCFMYNNEELLLDIRLSILSKYIKKFILVESLVDHQGNAKKNSFQIENFKKYKDKIIHLKIESFPEKLNGTWERENFQRNFISNATENLLDDDYIIISDVDEIPNLRNYKYSEKFKFTVFQQSNFCFKFNMKNMTFPNWYGSKLCKKKYLKSPQWLRNQKVKKRFFFEFYKIKWNIVQNGGWHFSFLMNPHQIISKIKSFAHDEFNKSEFLEINEIKKKITSGIDLFNRDQKYQKVNFDKTFPKIILENMDKYKEWIA